MGKPTGPRYEYFDHEADIGVIGRGPTLEEAFVQAARATFAIMADPAEVAASETISVAFLEQDVEFALVSWLNALLVESRLQGLALCEFELQREGAAWIGLARGAPWSPTQDRGTEVKGATLTMLLVARDHGGGWQARCVVDV